MKIVYLLPDTGIAGGVLNVFEHLDRLAVRGHEVSLCVMTEDAPEVKWYPLTCRIVPIDKIREETRQADIVIATHYHTAFLLNDLDINAAKGYFVQHKESLFVNEDNILKSLNIQNPSIPGNMLKQIAKNEAIKRKRAIESTYDMPFFFLATSDWLANDVLWGEHGKQSTQIYCAMDKKKFFPEPAYSKNKIRVLLETTQQKTSWKGLNDAIAVLEGDPELREKIEVWTLSADDPIYTGDKHWKRPSQDEIRRIFSSCDIFLKTSWYEGWGLGIMQAMTCGCAVVTSDNLGCKTFSRDGYNCMMVDNKFSFKNNEDYVNELRNKLHYLVDTPTARRELIKNGIESMKRFNWEDEVDKLENALQSVILLGPIEPDKELSEYFGEDIETTREKMRNAEKVLSAEWGKCNPKTNTEINAFYSESENYVYDITNVNSKLFRRLWAKVVAEMIIKNGGKRHLDFGAGCGDLLFYIEKILPPDVELFYYDLPGKAQGFAKWRAKKRKSRIKFLNSLDNIDDFESLSVIDALEHVKEPMSILKNVLSKLKKDSPVFIEAPFFATLKTGHNYPMHLEENLKYALNTNLYFKGLGLAPVDNSQYIYRGSAEEEYRVIDKLSDSPVNFIVREGVFDKEILREIFEFLSYQVNGFRIENGFNIIDIGAHIGGFSIWAARQGASVIAFEPSRENYVLLSKNVASNNVGKNIRLMNFAVCANNKSRKLGTVSGNMGASSLLKDNTYIADAHEKVKCKSIKDVLTEQEKVDLLKLDCEGSEYEITEAISARAFKKIDRIVMEWHKIEKNDPKDLFRLLRKHYKYGEIKYITSKVGFIRVSHKPL